MATVSVYSALGYSFSPLDLNLFFNHTNKVQVSAEIVQFFSDDGRLAEYRGTGLVLDGTGALAGGTITSIAYVVSGDFKFNIIDLSLDAAAFYNAVTANNSAAVFDALFGGGDAFFGGTGADTFVGGAGINFFVGNAGNDTFDGSAAVGYDIASYEYDTGVAGVVADLTAGSATDTYGQTDTLTDIEDLRGSLNADTLLGSAGDDIIMGLAGGDTLDGRGGQDIVSYEWEHLRGGTASIVLSLSTETATDTFGNTDNLAGFENVSGSVFGDTITGSDLDNGVSGFGGNDTISGGAGIDALGGGIGNDTLDGGADGDFLEGGAGNDTYNAVDAGDTLIEFLGEGYDTVNTGLANFTLAANVERVNYTGAGNFVGTGNNLANRFQAGAGNDRFVDVLGGADIFSGGAGTDTVDFRTTATVVVLDFTTNVHGGAAAGDSYSGIEKFLGSNTANDAMTAGGTGRAVYAGYGGNDILTGGVKNDQLLGGSDNDTLSGGGDRDSLDGGTGNDTLTGGGQGDVFVFTDPAFGQDTITDYQDGLDEFKVLSAVADDVLDFTISGNGTNTVVLSLIAAPLNTITLNGLAAITISNADFVFY